MRRSLLDEVARLVETNSVPLGVAHSLTNSEVVGLTGVAVPCGTPEPIQDFLFELWDCASISL